MTNYLLARLRSTWRPGMYHGHGKTRDFFEGWYFKCVDASEQHVHAVIPGIFLGQRGQKSHCFVQVLDGLTGHSTYQTYPLDAFWASDHDFDLRVGANHFHAEGMSLDIDAPDRVIRGEVRFDRLVPWPVTVTSPGVIGPYAFAPFMECYHGVIGLDHSLAGSLLIDGQQVCFDGGRGYMEKDWGRSFPQAWLWTQSNHFPQPGTSLSLSVATVPWLGSSFRGFIAGLWHAGQLYRFASYTGARIESLRLTDTTAHLRVADKHHRLEVDAARSAGGLLHAPFRVEMMQRVLESLTARVDVRLCALKAQGDEVIFEGTGRHAGLEINGELQQIFD